jgi:hypothetical protein
MSSYKLLGMLLDIQEELGDGQLSLLEQQGPGAGGRHRWPEASSRPQERWSPAPPSSGMGSQAPDPPHSPKDAPDTARSSM